MAAVVPLIAGMAGQAVATSMATAAGIAAGTATYSAIASAGFMIGSAIGSVLMAPDVPAQQGPRASDNKVQTSTYGAPIFIPYGRVKIAGNIIWDYGICEVKTTEEVGGKGGGGAEVTTYTYYDSWAVGLCEGKVSTVHKIWFDSNLVYDSETGTVNEAIKDKFEIYYGDEAQTPDPLIEAVIGYGKTPAFRNLCYVVFDNVLLQDWGSRVPNIVVELTRSPDASVSSEIYPVEQLDYLDGLGNLAFLYSRPSLIPLLDSVDPSGYISAGSLPTVVSYKTYTYQEAVDSAGIISAGSLPTVVSYEAYTYQESLDSVGVISAGNLAISVAYVAYTILPDSVDSAGLITGGSLV